MTKIHCILIFLAFASCKEVTFKDPQPTGRKSLSEIPKELRGKYLVVEKDESTQDTIIVTNRGYFVSSDSSAGTLSDSLILKKYKGYYFFNINENPEWILRIIKKEQNGDLSYLVIDSYEKSFQEFLVELNREIKIDSFEVNNERLYQIDPSPKKLISLIDKGFFKKTITLKKIH